MESPEFLNVTNGPWIVSPYLYSAPQHISSMPLNATLQSRNSSVSTSLDHCSSSASSGIALSAPTTPRDEVPTNLPSTHFHQHASTATMSGHCNHCPHHSHHPELFQPHSSQPITDDALLKPTHASQNSDCAEQFDWYNPAPVLKSTPTSSRLTVSSDEGGRNESDTITSRCSPLDPLILASDSLQPQRAWSSSSTNGMNIDASTSVRMPSTLNSLLGSSATSWDESFARNTANPTVDPSDTLSVFQQDQFHYFDNSHFVEGYVPTLEGPSMMDMDAPSFLDSPLPVEPGGRQASLSTQGGEYSSNQPPRSPTAAATHLPSSRSGVRGEKPLVRQRRRPKSVARKHTFVQGIGWVASEPARNDRIPCSFNCGQKFNRREHCTRHEKMHTNERPYICSLALNSGSDWCKIQEDRSDSEVSRTKKKSTGIGRSDNQFQHYVTHLKWRHEGRKTRNNKCADKTFLYWIIWRHEGPRAYRVFDMVEAQMKKHNTPLGEPNFELMRKHPEWPEYVAWREAGGTLADLGYDGQLLQG